MKLAIFGLTISSSWGNGHATLWRGLCRALEAQGHEVVFFERDMPYYRAERDAGPFGCDWVLYSDWESVRKMAKRTIDGCDAAIVTSYCPDARIASDLVLESRVPARVFYDLDSPVTLALLERGQDVEYLPTYGLGDFDLVLSYAGGRALEELRKRLGARHTAPLYGSVDVSIYRPAPARELFAGDLSYLGTYAEDRHRAFQSLFLEPARRLPARRFVLGGSLYPENEAFPENLRRLSHVHPSDHPAFYSSCRLTLNITRKPMIELGWCPSGRLFEAAACGVPVISDDWEGLDSFFEPGRELLLVENSEDVESALELGETELCRIGHAARERVWAEHRADIRAAQLVRWLSSPRSSSPQEATSMAKAVRAEKEG